MVDRSQVARWLVAAGAAVTLIGTFLPWLSSGTVPRSSYELFSIVERLGFSPDGAVGWALRLWPLAPLLLVFSAVVQGIAPTDRWRLVARLVIPLAAVVYVGGTAVAVRLAPEAWLFRLRLGIWVTLVGALAMLVGIALRPDRAERPDPPVTPSESEPSAAS